MAAATSFAAFALCKKLIATLKPRSAAIFAVAAPMPRLAPVTRSTGLADAIDKPPIWVNSSEPGPKPLTIAGPRPAGPLHALPSGPHGRPFSPKLGRTTQQSARDKPYRKRRQPGSDKWARRQIVNNGDHREDGPQSKHDDIERAEPQNAERMNERVRDECQDREHCNDNHIQPGGRPQ